MADSNSGIERGKSVHGARGYIVFNKRPVGYAEAISYSIQWQIANREVLDRLQVAEHVVTGMTVSFQIDLAKISNRSVIERGLLRRIEEVFTNPGQRNIAIVDRPNGSVIDTIEDITWEGLNMGDIRKGVLASDRLTGRAIQVRDHAGRVYAP